MEFFSLLSTGMMYFANGLQGLAGYIIPFLIVMTIIVFIHELGHFLVARWCGVKVDEFSIGFGKELFGFNDKHKTRWKFCLLPLGGYVKFAGDMNAASVPEAPKDQSLTDEEKSELFHFKPLWQRAAVVAAGPIANFILAIALFAFLASFYGIPKPLSAHVDKITPGSPAEIAGFKVGDEIKVINGTKVSSFEEVRRMVTSIIGEPLKIQILRDGKRLDLQATPKIVTIENSFKEKIPVNILGIQRTNQKKGRNLEKKSLSSSIEYGFNETWFIIHRTVVFLKNLIVGKESAQQLSGPIGIAKIASQVATVSWYGLVYLGAVLSVSIGFLNLFPIPMLDGGHLVFYGIEALRGKALSEEAMNFGFKIGLFLLISLMIFATANDIIKLFPN